MTNIEHLLRAAATDAQAAASFIAEFADAEFVVPVAPPRSGVADALADRQRVDLQVFEADGVVYGAVFTSLDRLREAGAPERYVELSGRHLAANWPDTLAMAINPGTDVGAVLSPDQVRAMSAAAGTVVMPAGSQVAVGAPAEEPAPEITAAVAAAAAGRPGVESVYLLEMADRELGPRLVAGVVLAADADRQLVMPPLADAVFAARPEDAPDVMVLDGELLETVARYVDPLPVG